MFSLGYDTGLTQYYNPIQTLIHLSHTYSSDYPPLCQCWHLCLWAPTPALLYAPCFSSVSAMHQVKFLREHTATRPNCNYEVLRFMPFSAVLFQALS